MARSVLSHPENVLELFRTVQTSTVLKVYSRTLQEQFWNKINVLQVFQNSSIEWLEMFQECPCLTRVLYREIKNQHFLLRSGQAQRL